MQEEPELILRRGYNINRTGKVPYPVPELLIVGNKAGLLWLADMLQRQAQGSNKTDRAERDPDDHQHITPVDTEVNGELSDEMEIRIGVLDSKNRNAVLAKYGIAADTRKTGSLIGQYERDIESARTYLKRFA